MTGIKTERTVDANPGMTPFDRQVAFLQERYNQNLPQEKVAQLADIHEDDDRWESSWFASYEILTNKIVN